MAEPLTDDQLVAVAGGQPADGPYHSSWSNYYGGGGGYDDCCPDPLYG